MPHKVTFSFPPDKPNSVTTEVDDDHFSPMLVTKHL